MTSSNRCHRCHRAHLHLPTPVHHQLQRVAVGSSCPANAECLLHIRMRLLGRASHVNTCRHICSSQSTLLLASLSSIVQLCHPSLQEEFLLRCLSPGHHRHQLPALQGCLRLSHQHCSTFMMNNRKTLPIMTLF